MQGGRVAIVGAGISGLACAWRLDRAGFDVTLLERSDRVGGVIGTREVGGFVFETGPNTVPASSAISKLVAELGLGDDLVEAPNGLPRWVYRGGALRRVPQGLFDLVTTDLLSWSTKLGLLAEPFAPARPEGDESIADFVERRLGREILDVLVAPLVSGTFAGDPSRLSVRSAFPRLARLEEARGSLVLGALLGLPDPEPEAGRRTLVSFRGGQATLPRRLAERLEDRVRLGVAVESIRAVDGALELHAAGGETERFDAIVVATTPDAAGEILAEVAPDAASVLGAFEAPPLAIVGLGFDASALPQRLEGFGYLVPRGEGPRTLGTVWSSSVFSDRAPAGGAALASFLGGATDPEIGTLDDAAVVAIARADLRTILGLEAEPVAVVVERYARAIPQVGLGHADRIARVRSATSAVPGLFLAGNYLAGVAVGDCIATAGRTAQDVAAHLATR